MIKLSGLPSKKSPEPVPLGEVLAAVAERIHYAESRRTNFTVMAGALLAGGVGVLTFAIDKHIARTVIYPTMIAAIGAIVVGFTLLLIYARQTNRYPWTDATKTWKWFYRDAIPQQQNFDSKFWTVFYFGSEKERIKHEYAAQLPEFTKRIKTLQYRDISFDQDVQQLYVLHINEKFKNIHLSQLRNILQKGIIIVFITSLVALFYGIYADRMRLAERIVSEEQEAYKIEGTWRFISLSDDDQTVLVQVNIQNKLQTAILTPTWVFLDDHQIEIPTKIVAATEKTESIDANITARYSLFLRPAENVNVISLQAHTK